MSRAAGKPLGSHPGLWRDGARDLFLLDQIHQAASANDLQDLWGVRFDLEGTPRAQILDGPLFEGHFNPIPGLEIIYGVGNF
jgi:hypothetical protein